MSPAAWAAASKPNSAKVGHLLLEPDAESLFFQFVSASYEPVILSSPATRPSAAGEGCWAGPFEGDDVGVVSSAPPSRGVTMHHPSTRQMVGLALAGLLSLTTNPRTEDAWTPG